MKNSHRKFTSRIMKVIVGVLMICTMGLLLCRADESFAASAIDTKKQTVAPLSTQEPGTTAPSPTAPPSGTMMQQGPSKWLPRVTIDYFKKAPAPGMMGATVGGTAPDSITVQYGESITLHWGIKACNVSRTSVSLSGTGIDHWDTGIENSDMQQHTTPDGCTYYRGERTITLYRSGSYRVKAVGTPSNFRAFPSPVQAEKSYFVNVPLPALNIRKPEVNENTMEITFFMDNSGTGAITSGAFNVSFTINDPATNNTICRNSFTTPPLDIPRGGRNVRLGSVSLDSNRDQLLSRNSVKIEVYVNNFNTRTTAQPQLEERRTFSHTWDRKTFVIDTTLLSILSSLSSYDMRLNNYGGGVHPNVPNDCHINLTLMGTAANSGNFSLNPSPYVEEVLIAIPPSPIPIKQKVAIYVNNIVASKTAASDLLFIRDGKLGIHLEFPNSGSREIKTGFHNWGKNNEFRDNPVGDIELGPFSIDVLLTPELRDGKISYGRVEIQVQDLSASVVGAMDDTLNRSGMIRRYLNRTLRDIIVSQLTSIVDSDRMRNAFEEGIAANLPGNITRILGVSSVGSTITVRYL